LHDHRPPTTVADLPHSSLVDDSSIRDHARFSLARALRHGDAMRFLVLLALMTLAVQPGCGPADGARPAEITPSRRPPARPSVTVAGERRWFVLSRVWFGLRDYATGEPSQTAWTQLGLDLDRRTTTKDDSKVSRNTCARRAGSSTGALADGAEGIDNNFGAHILPVLRSLKSDFEESANSALLSGRYTLLLRIDGVVDGDNARAPGALYAAGPFDGTPSFAPTERWPVWSSTVVDGDVDKPVRKFPLGYVSNGVWVSGEIGESPEPIWIPIIDGPVDLHASAVLTLDTRNGHGLIAGALPDKELIRAADGWLAKFDICSNDLTYKQIGGSLTQSADLVIGATDLQDTTRTCDAMSFAIGFDAVPAAAPVAVIAAPPGPPPLRTCE